MSRLALEGCTTRFDPKWVAILCTTFAVVAAPVEPLTAHGANAPATSSASSRPAASQAGAVYEVVARHSDKCLDVKAVSSEDGARLQQWSCHGGANQQWRVEAVTGEWVRLVAQHSGKCLDVTDWSIENGTQLQQWACGDGENQQWTLQVRRHRVTRRCRCTRRPVIPTRVRRTPRASGTTTRCIRCRTASSQVPCTDNIFWHPNVGPFIGRQLIQHLVTSNPSPAYVMKVTRREFLLQSGHACFGYALGAAAFVAGVQRFSLINALAQGSDYRALVCVFLAGGNDGNNMVVPATTSEYEAYAAVRSSSGLAIARDTLLPISPAGIGSPFGLHPSLVELQALWNEQKAAIVCNVGPLVRPLTREQYQLGAPRPYQLFSHSDQVAQWQTAISDRVGQSGWGGRTADRFDLSASGYPMVTALSGGIFTRGLTTGPLAVSAAPTPLNQVLVLNGFGTATDERARWNAMEVLRSVDHDNALVAGASRTTQQAVNIGQMLSSDPSLSTVFPNTTLGNQLKQVAKLVKFNSETPSIGLTPQIGSPHLKSISPHRPAALSLCRQGSVVRPADRSNHDSILPRCPHRGESSCASSHSVHSSPRSWPSRGAPSGGRCVSRAGSPISSAIPGDCSICLRFPRVACSRRSRIDRGCASCRRSAPTGSPTNRTRIARPRVSI
jgi:uncharacterized protein (DUF1501 family)